MNEGTKGLRSPEACSANGLLGKEAFAAELRCSDVRLGRSSTCQPDKRRRPKATIGFQAGKRRLDGCRLNNDFDLLTGMNFHERLHDRRWRGELPHGSFGRGLLLDIEHAEDFAPVFRHVIAAGGTGSHVQPTCFVSCVPSEVPDLKSGHADRVEDF